MRRNRTKIRKNSNGNYLKFWGILVLLCVLSISIGFFGTKYFLYPKYLAKQNNTVSEKVDNKEADKSTESEEIASKEDEKAIETDKEQLAQKKSYTFVILPLNIYNIQVGSFDDMSNAQSQIERLKNQGLGGYVVDSEKYKVMVMSFTERDSAEKFKNTIKTYYSDAFISPKQLSSREINYDDEGKAYSEVASKQIEELKKYYENYSKFLSNNDISSVETNIIVEFVDNEINRLNQILKAISNTNPSEDFTNFNNKFTNIVKDSKTKLQEAKNSSFEDRTKLFEIFMESINLYENIV